MKRPEILQRLKIGITKVNNWMPVKINVTSNITTIKNNILNSCHIPYITNHSFFSNEFYLDGVIIYPIPNFYNYTEEETLFIGVNTKNKFDIFYHRPYYFEPFFPMNKDRITEVYLQGYHDTLDYFS